MPYPPGFVRCAITASLQDGEQMVHTFHIKDVRPPGSEPASLQVLADGVRDKWTTCFLKVYGAGTWAAQLSSKTVYQRVTVYDIDAATGRARDLAESAFGSTVLGSSGGTWPTEVALCATLSTGKPGRTRRGRMYLGGLGNNLGMTATGRVNPPGGLTAASFLADFFRQVRNIDVSTGQQDKWEPQVVSTTTGSASKITAVQIGDVFDVQRRRRNKISEARQVVQVG